MTKERCYQYGITAQFKSEKLPYFIDREPFQLIPLNARQKHVGAKCRRIIQTCVTVSYFFFLFVSYFFFLFDCLIMQYLRIYFALGYLGRKVTANDSEEHISPWQ